MASVLLGVWTSDEFKSIQIENIDLGAKVQTLKAAASKKLENFSQNNQDLIYCGLVLEDDNATLSSYGISSGCTVHVVKKPTVTTTPRNRALNEAEVQQLVSSFRKFTASSYRPALQRLSRPEVLEKIIANVPSLVDDPAALAIIQDPELIVHMADPDTVRRAAERHPALVEAANYVSTYIREQGNTDPNQAGTSTGYSYSLEALSDDEEMETSNRESPHPLSRNTSYNAITAAQLAAAIANATNTAFNTNSAGMPTTANNSTSGGGSAGTGVGILTNEMFSNALQQALGAYTTGNNGGNAPNRSEIETIEAITRRLQPQLQQMHELGLTNDSINVRALQATSGDVEAAIELVFNGVID